MPCLWTYVDAMSTKPILKLDWCSHAAAKYAVEHWHYSHSLPAGKNVKLGVWENQKYIGIVMFILGANSNLHTPFAVTRWQICELTRIALSKHATPVSRIVAIAIKMLQHQSPGLRLIVSYADTNQNHYGGIYQAGGWIYVGIMQPDSLYFVRDKWVHHRQASSLLGSIAGLPSKPSSAKHKYLYPLDAAMRAQILPLAKPYPKRAVSTAASAPVLQAGEGGSSPTTALLAPHNLDNFAHGKDVTVYSD